MQNVKLGRQPKALALLHLNPITGITEQKGSRAVTAFQFLLLFVGTRGLSGDYADYDWITRGPIH